MSNKINDIVAVVMAGGKSKRMGKDKGLIEYKKKPHRYFLAEMLKEVFDEVVISVPYLYDFPNNNYKYINDVKEGIGPIGGIYSLFKMYPKKALFLIATDMPDTNIEQIKYLLEKRHSDKYVTCFRNKNGFNEPLFAIWENKSKKIIEKLVGENKLSLNKFIANHNSHIVDVPVGFSLININTPDEKESYNKLLNKNTATNNE